MLKLNTTIMSNDNKKETITQLLVMIPKRSLMKKRYPI